MIQHTCVFLYNIGAAGAIASIVHDGFMNPIEGEQCYM